MSTQVRKPDDANKMPEDSALRAAARDLMSAVSTNDVSGVAKALRAAFQILDSEPHFEGEHEEV